MHHYIFLMVVERSARKMTIPYVYYVLEACNFMCARFIFTYKAL